MGNIDFQRVEALMTALGVDLDQRSPFLSEGALDSSSRSMRSQVESKVYTALEETFRRIDDLIRSGQFEYRVGYAEEVLPELQGKAHAVLDVWGPGFYSPDRISLLENEYRAMRQAPQHS
jgi:hypothetical protein